MASSKFDITIGSQTQTVYNKDAVDKLLSGVGGGPTVLRLSNDDGVVRGDTSATHFLYYLNAAGDVNNRIKVTGTYDSARNITIYPVGQAYEKCVSVFLSTQTDADTTVADWSKVLWWWADAESLWRGSSVTQLVKSDFALQYNYEWLHTESATTSNFAMLGYHEYTGGWKAVELGNEEHHLTLNSYDDGTTTLPQSTTELLLGRPLVNWKDSTANSKQDAVALVNQDIVPLAARVNNLEKMGSWLASFGTYASVPTTVSAFVSAKGVTPTVNDEVTVQADETKQGQADIYRVTAIDGSGNITWTYDYDLGSGDITGKVDKVTTSGTVTRSVTNTTSALGMSYADSGNTGNNAALAIVAGTVNLSVGTSGITVAAGTTPGTTNDVTLKRLLAYASLVDASVISLGELKQYASISGVTPV